MARNQNDDLPKAKINSQNLKQFLGIYKFMTPYRMFFVGGLLCLVLSSVIILAFPFLTGKLIDISLGKKAQFEFGEFSFALDNIDQIAVFLISILLIQSVFSFFRVYFFAQVSEKSMADIRIALYQKLMTLPLLFYDSRRVGELNSRITADVAVLQSTFSLELAEFVRQITILVAGLGILFVKTPQLTFFMLATIPILVLAALFFGKSIRKFSKETQDKLAQANTIVEETLQSISMVKAFTNERYEVKRYKTALEDTVKTALLSANYRGIFVSFIILAIFGGIVAVIW
ncbi:MAG: ABC transporter ATP-binding protein, partial [Bacteroidetes bacterium]